MIHGQLLRMGERLYGDSVTGMQYSFLRAKPAKPECNRQPNVDALVKTQMQANAADEFADFFGTASEADVRASILAGVQQCEESISFMIKPCNIWRHTQVFVPIVILKPLFLVFLNSEQKIAPFY